MAFFKNIKNQVIVLGTEKGPQIWIFFCMQQKLLMLTELPYM